MAQAATGFPWHNNSSARAPLRIPEEPPSIERKPSDSGGGTSDSASILSPLSATSEKHRLSVKGKKRTGSLPASRSNKAGNKSAANGSSGLGPRHYNVRTIPAWVQDADEDDLEYGYSQEYLDTPHAALVAQHNHAPSDTRRDDRDYITSSGGTRPEPMSRWVSFARASVYPREQFHGERVTAAWLNEHFTDYSKPWLEGQDEDDQEKGRGVYKAFRRKRKAWYERSQITILRNPFVPLAFRLTVIVFAAAATALGASIYSDARVVVKCTNQDVHNRTPQCLKLLGTEPVNYYQDPSALMAVIVDVIAIAYTFYITYDEYFSKPLGLRRARAKVRLVLLDLFFIVFQAANLALAFESLTVDEGPCAVGADVATATRFDRICDRAAALSAVLIISLVAWLLTFSVSILRLVERINAR